MMGLYLLCAILLLLSMDPISKSLAGSLAYDSEIIFLDSLLTLDGDEISNVGLNLTQLSVYRDIVKQVKVYYEQHNLGVLRSESPEKFCSRKYVMRTVEHFNCITGTGNQIGQFLQDFIYAIITNRTFIIPHSPQFDCKNGFSIYDWIPYIADIYDLSLRHNCSDGIIDEKHRNSTMKTSIKKKDINQDDVYHNILPYLRKPDAVDLYRCNALDLSSTVVNPYSRHHNSHYLVFNNIWYKSDMKEHIARANILYRDTYEDNARFHAYGLLQMMSLNFTQPVRQAVEKVWNQTMDVTNSIRISVHIRHQRKTAEEEYIVLDLAYIDVIKWKREEFRDKKCFIYLGSERESTIQRVIRASDRLNCSVHVIDRSQIEAYNPKEKVEKAIDHGIVRPTDHGVYSTGIIPYADILLLSSGDILIGKSGSTFSMLVANSVAFNALRRGIRSPLIWLDKAGNPSNYIDSQRSLCLSIDGKKRCECS